MRIYIYFESVNKILLLDIPMLVINRSRHLKNCMDDQKDKSSHKIRVLPIFRLPIFLLIADRFFIQINFDGQL